VLDSLSQLVALADGATVLPYVERLSSRLAMFVAPSALRWNAVDALRCGAALVGALSTQLTDEQWKWSDPLFQCALSLLTEPLDLDVDDTQCEEEGEQSDVDDADEEAEVDLGSRLLAAAGKFISVLLDSKSATLYLGKVFFHTLTHNLFSLSLSISLSLSLSIYASVFLFVSVFLSCTRGRVLIPQNPHWELLIFIYSCVCSLSRTLSNSLDTHWADQVAKLCEHLLEQILEKVFFEDDEFLRQQQAHLLRSLLQSSETRCAKVLCGIYIYMCVCVCVCGCVCVVRCSRCVRLFVLMVCFCRCFFSFTETPPQLTSPTSTAYLLRSSAWLRGCSPAAGRVCRGA
jgi:hypothetical protein